MASMSKRTIIGAASFRTFRCIWMLEELGIPYFHRPAMPGSPEVLRYNPLGKIPVFLDDDGFAMYESAAINTFLGDKYREKCSNNLVPLSGSHLRGQYDQTISVLTTELDSQGLWIHRKHEVMGDIFTHIPSAVDHARKYFNKTNRSLIQQLKDGGPYLLGQEFTAADIIYVHCLDWSKQIGWDKKWKEDEDLLTYLDLCKKRKAYRAAKAVRDTERLRSPTHSQSNI